GTVSRYQTLEANAQKRGRNADLQAMRDLKKLMDEKTTLPKSKATEGIDQRFIEEHGEPMTTVDSNHEISNPLSKDTSSLRHKFSDALSESLSKRLEQAENNDIEELKNKNARFKKNLANLDYISMRQGYYTGQIAGGLTTNVHISLEGLNINQQTDILRIAKTNGKSIKTWKTGFSGSGITFTLPKGSRDLAISQVIEIIKHSLGISPKQDLAFWTPTIGPLYNGLTFTHPDGRIGEVTISENTKLSQIDNLVDLTVVFDVSSQKLYDAYPNYKEFRTNHAYKLGGNQVLDRLAATETEVQVFNYLAGYTSNLGNKLLKSIGLKDQSGYNFENLLAQSNMYHNSLYLNNDIKNKILTGNINENKLRWKNWKISSENKYKVAMGDLLKNSEGVFKELLKRTAEDLLIDIILKDNLHLDKTPEEGDYTFPTIVDKIELYLTDSTLKKELENLILGPKGISLFWNKFAETFFDSAKSQTITFGRNPYTYHGRIGEKIVYTDIKPSELSDLFIENNYQPIEFISSINYGSSSSSGNVYAAKGGLTIQNSKNKIYNLNFNKLTSSVISNARIYDGDIAISDEAYSAGPTKHTVTIDGIGSSTSKQIFRDMGSIQRSTLFLEVSRGVTQLKDIKHLDLSTTAPAKDPISTHSLIISFWSNNHKPNDYGTGSRLKLPSDTTFASAITETLNLKLKLSNAKDEQAALKIVRDYLKSKKNLKTLKDLFISMVPEYFSLDRIQDLDGMFE
ncbi:hypothetical protein LCGC14_2000200, partial [marine sediment metagenome]